MEKREDEVSHSTTERRRWPRQPAVEEDAYMFWFDGEKIWQGAARLVNISRGGALLIAALAPPGNVVVRVRLDRTIEGVDAAVLLATPLESGHYELRLEFRETCPETFFQAAVKGINAEARARRG
jgi:hypothetical protein